MGVPIGTPVCQVVIENVYKLMIALYIRADVAIYFNFMPNFIKNIPKSCD